MLSREGPGKRSLSRDICSCPCPGTTGLRDKIFFLSRDKGTTGRPVPVCPGTSRGTSRPLETLIWSTYKYILFSKWNQGISDEKGMLASAFIMHLVVQTILSCQGQLSFEMSWQHLEGLIRDRIPRSLCQNRLLEFSTIIIVHCPPQVSCEQVGGNRSE